MKYRRLGKTDLRVSVIGVGTWQLGGEWGKDFEQGEVDAMLAGALDVGINLIDTAECYGDHLSERLVGNAIEGCRDEWVVATKFGHKFNGRFERDDIFDADGVRVQLEDSLRALKTDYIDLYQCHSPGDEVFENAGLWEMLAEQVQAGRIRHLGISISAKVDGVLHSDSASRVGAEALQVVYNRLDRKPEDHVFAAAIEQDLGVLARVPLASGFLSGKYGRGSHFEKTDVRAMWKDAEQRDAIVEQVERVKSEVPEGAAMAQWALAWCLQDAAVSCVIPGCKNLAQV